jgi:hypothetical protein
MLPLFLNNYVGVFHTFQGPRRPLGKVGVSLYCVFQTSALEGVRVISRAPAAFYLQERLVSHCTGGWVGPRAGLDRCGISRPHRD